MLSQIIIILEFYLKMYLLSIYDDKSLMINKIKINRNFKTI